MKMLFSALMTALMAAVFCSTAMAQSDQIKVPLHFGMQSPVLNEFGDVLPGTAASPGALVQILRAYSPTSTPGASIIEPPGLNGEPSTNNPLLAVSQIGSGTDPAAGPLGKASGSVRINRYQSNPIFARIFNAATLEDSSFYADSSVYTNSTTKYGVFYITVAATTNELDTSDSDGDGLSGSWETSYGTDANNPDSDNDGILDGQEILAGTDANDGDDFLKMVELISAGGGDMTVMWDAVPGKIYQLEYTTNALGDLVSFEAINPPVTSVAATASTLITNGSVPAIGTSFRVKVIVP